ncbi:MAG: hypothetical protein JNM22_00690 [Saprospiraceae bacterium]|nr:hypothetical protein [Saprospiraceae bacterium]
MHTLISKAFVVALFFCTLCTTASAQRNPEMRDKKVQAYRVAVFTEVLNLSPSEAESFWPIFNEYLDKKEEVQAQLKPSTQLDGMNDNEVEEYVRKYFELRQRELDLEKDLGQKLRKVLPVRKIAKIPVAEREFRESLLKKLQENRQKRLDRMGRTNGRN